LYTQNNHFNPEGIKKKSNHVYVAPDTNPNIKISGPTQDFTLFKNESIEFIKYDDHLVANINLGSRQLEATNPQEYIAAMERKIYILQYIVSCNPDIILGDFGSPYVYKDFNKTFIYSNEYVDSIANKDGNFDKHITKENLRTEFNFVSEGIKLLFNKLKFYRFQPQPDSIEYKDSKVSKVKYNNEQKQNVTNCIFYKFPIKPIFSELMEDAKTPTCHPIRFIYSISKSPPPPLPPLSDELENANVAFFAKDDQSTNEFYTGTISSNGKISFKRPDKTFEEIDKSYYALPEVGTKVIITKDGNKFIVTVTDKVGKGVIYVESEDDTGKSFISYYNHFLLPKYQNGNIVYGIRKGKIYKLIIHSLSKYTIQGLQYNTVNNQDGNIYQYFEKHIYNTSEEAEAAKLQSLQSVETAKPAKPVLSTSPEFIPESTLLLSDIVPPQSTLQSPAPPASPESSATPPASPTPQPTLPPESSAPPQLPAQPAASLLSTTPATETEATPPELSVAKTAEIETATKEASLLSTAPQQQSGVSSLLSTASEATPLLLDTVPQQAPATESSATPPASPTPASSASVPVPVAPSQPILLNPKNTSDNSYINFKKFYSDFSTIKEEHSKIDIFVKIFVPKSPNMKIFTPDDDGNMEADFLRIVPQDIYDITNPQNYQKIYDFITNINTFVDKVFKPSVAVANPGQPGNSAQQGKPEQPVQSTAQPVKLTAQQGKPGQPAAKSANAAAKSTNPAKPVITVSSITGNPLKKT